jgi:hypothetical protein
MPAYRRRERVVFLQDFNKDSFGRSSAAFPVGPNSEQKWARKGDTGVVSSWSKGGWLKVRLDRHGAIVTVRAGQTLGRPTPPAVTKAVWSQEAKENAADALVCLEGTQRQLRDLNLHMQVAINEMKPADVEVIETMRLELEEAARILLKLSFSVPTQISPFPTMSFGAMQSRASTPSPVMVPDESSNGEAVECVGAREKCTQLFG